MYFCVSRHISKPLGNNLKINQCSSIQRDLSELLPVFCVVLNLLLLSWWMWHSNSQVKLIWETVNHTKNHLAGLSPSVATGNLSHVPANLPSGSEGVPEVTAGLTSFHLLYLPQWAKEEFAPTAGSFWKFCHMFCGERGLLRTAEEWAKATRIVERGAGSQSLWQRQQRAESELL